MIGKFVRAIKEAPILNEFYRIYTERLVAQEYKNKQAQKVFTEIKEGNKWGGKESVSGLGSDFIQTKIIIEEIPKLLRKYKVNTFLDLPCGDHIWMNEVDLGQVKYTGADIVENLIIANNQKYNAPNKEFITLDLMNSKLPEADLILVRDCLVHLSFDNIKKVFANLKKSNIKYILTTTFPKTRRNYDITTGNWRPLNLRNKPFYFPEPIDIILEGCTESYGQYTDKSLGLWRIDELPNSILEN